MARVPLWLLLLLPLLLVCSSSQRWRVTVPLLKCCTAGQALVRRGAQEEPVCAPVPVSALQLPPLVGETPDASLSILPHHLRHSDQPSTHNNLSCARGHFWLDGGRSDQEFTLLRDGSLRWRHALFPPGSHCSDRLLGGGRPVTATRVCNVTLKDRGGRLTAAASSARCAQTCCLRKCCPRGLVIRRSDMACVLAETPWTPVFHRHHTAPAETAYFRVVAGMPACLGEDGEKRGMFSLEPDRPSDHPRAGPHRDRFFLQEDGRLWAPSQTMIEAGDFCVDRVLYDEPHTPQQPAEAGDATTSTPPASDPPLKNQEAQLAVVCFPPPAAVRPAPSPLLTCLQAGSAAGLLGVLLVHVLVPTLRNLHGRCLVSHASALLTAFSCLLAAAQPAVYLTPAACQAVALLMYFSFLSSCFWLNAMSFDIWLTFSRLRSAPPKANQRGRFARYSLYSWCCPLLLTLLTTLMQFMPDQLGAPAAIPRPGLGRLNCWFPGSLEMLVYFHWPVLLLMAGNLLLFVATARSLRRGERDAERVRKRRRGTERLKIYLHLFVVMGVPWISEALSKHFGPTYIWFATDILNSVQGMLIFLLLVLRSGTRRALQRQTALWWRRTLAAGSSGRGSRSASASSRQTASSAGGSSGRSRSASGGPRQVAPPATADSGKGGSTTGRAKQTTVRTTGANSKYTRVISICDKQNDSMSYDSKHTDSTANNLKHTDSISNDSKHTDSMSNDSKHIDSIANGSKHTDSICNGPKHTNSAYNSPKHAYSISNGPKHTDSISNNPKRSNSIHNYYKCANSISNGPTHADSISNGPTHTDASKGPKHIVCHCSSYSDNRCRLVNTTDCQRGPGTAV